jgi:hypothetical protein
MSYILFHLIVGIYHIIKWAIFKSRLWIIAIPTAIVLILFYDWYEANTILADAIGIVILADVLVRWIITLVRKIKDNKLERAYRLKKAYEEYGEPVVLKKHNVSEESNGN